MTVFVYSEKRGAGFFLINLYPKFLLMYDKELQSLSNVVIAKESIFNLVNKEIIVADVFRLKMLEIQVDIGNFNSTSPTVYLSLSLAHKYSYAQMSLRPSAPDSCILHNALQGESRHVCAPAIYPRSSHEPCEPTPSAG